MRKADRCRSIKRNGNCPLALRLRYLPSAKMLQLKLFAVLLTCLLLLGQKTTLFPKCGPGVTFILEKSHFQQCSVLWNIVNYILVGNT